MQNVCKICGRIFDASTYKNKICSDECRRTAQRMSLNKYRAKLLNENKPAEIPAEPVKTATRIIRTVYADTVKAENQSDLVIETLEKSIIDNLEMLDEIRNEISKLANDLKAKQSAYDQKDSEMVHAIERGCR